MFTRIGEFTVRHRRAVITLSLAFVAIAAVLGTGVFSRLDAGGFTDPTSESVLAAEAVADEFGSGQPNLVLLVDAADGDVDSAASSTAAAGVLDLVATDAAVAEAVSYWSLGSAPPLRSSDGATGLLLARVTGDDSARIETTEHLIEQIAELPPAIGGAVEVSAAGPLPANAAVTSTIEGDLARAESMAVPITLLLLVLVFGGLVAAGLPLLTGVVAVLGTFFTLYVITLVTDVSVFSINLVTALGLGLAIDYSLFIVSRFREELARRPRAEWNRDDRHLIDAALVRTVETAGRTVAFSGLTVAVSLAALLVFPMFFLRSFAYAGIGVTLVAVAASLLTLPATLAVLGRRVDAGRIPGMARRPARPTIDTDGFWYRTAMFAQRHAVAVSVGVVSVLVLLGMPFLSVAFGVPDERVLPEDDATRVATERLRSDFDTSEADSLPVVVRGSAEADSLTDAAIGAYAAEVSATPGVERVDAPTGRYVDGIQVAPTDAALANQRIDDAFRLNVVPSVTPISEEGERLVEDLRSIEYPGAESLVGGQSAEYTDTKDAIASRLPWALGLIALSTFVLLFLMFGSVLVPLKAIVLNVLSLSATFGAMVWVFQWGNGAGLLDFTATGLTDLTTPILMFCIAFGLSMDYEVFLLSRIAEEHRRGADNTTAVARGLQRTGRIVTAAAALLSVTFIAFATSGITFIKLFGLGLALAVLMDATVVRALLVPAFMRLAGDANWWAPRWMKRIHDRFGISESDGSPDAPVGPQSPRPVIPRSSRHSSPSAAEPRLRGDDSTEGTCSRPIRSTADENGTDAALNRSSELEDSSI